MCVSRFSIENFNTVSIFSYWSTHVIWFDYQSNENFANFNACFWYFSIFFFHYQVMMSLMSELLENSDMDSCGRKKCVFEWNFYFFFYFYSTDFSDFSPLVDFFPSHVASQFILFLLNCKFNALSCSSFYFFLSKCTRKFSQDFSFLIIRLFIFFNSL